MARRKRERDPYAEVGPVGRDAISRTRQHSRRLAKRDLRVFVACLGLTALYSKKWDYVTVDQIASAAGVSRQTASKSLHVLNELGVIEWFPSQVRGESMLSLVITGSDMGCR